MKPVNPIDKRLVRRSAWTGLMLLIIAAASLFATNLIQLYFIRKSLNDEAGLRAEKEIMAAKQQIDNVTYSVENATENLSWLTGYMLNAPDSLFVVLRHVLESEPRIVSCGVAFAENYYPKRGRWAEYLVAAREDGSFEEMIIGSQSHDYFSSEWYQVPFTTGKISWSKPYYDESGAKAMLITCSAPVRDGSGNIVGVAGADIPIEWMDELVADIDLYPGSYATIVNGDGVLLACPPDTSAGSNSMVYTSSLEHSGWKMSVVIPRDSIFGDVNRIRTTILILQLLALLLILFIMLYSARNNLRYKDLEESKNKIENELQIAHGIQMSMLPNIFPPFPNRNDLDMHAFLEPAKEVGGDIYDFYIRDEKMFFCIGDVSGKGVPASLVMAVTRSLFRNVSIHERSAMRIVSRMNESMSEINENNMFVTFFCGVLNMKTGHLRYCNAGHNAPLVFRGGEAEVLDVTPNLPLGIVQDFPFQEQEADLACGDSLFLYTDGITEAENASHRMFGEKRMTNALVHAQGSSREKLDALKKAVSSFVGDARQSDDMTTILIRYMNDKTPDKSERHLILHNEIGQVSLLEPFVNNIAEETGLDNSLANAINLALEEAVTNVIMYGYQEGSDGIVDVECIIREGILQFSIIDTGIPFDPTSVPEARIDASVEDRPVGGLGIYLVRNIMDTVKYKYYEGKNILTMTKKI